MSTPKKVLGHFFYAFQESKKGQVMHSADWKLDSDELKSLFNSKTKAIIFNNPNNPLGKVFTRAEVEEIADLCKKFNVLMISDDVYEHMARSQICDFVLKCLLLTYLTFILRHYFCCKHCGLLIRISYFCFVVLSKHSIFPS
jgi:histidinol-phosphate/aromatic aminotransferase/cobyric acid decarboxylase-like protein